MYYLPTSSLVLLFIFSLFHPFPCASRKHEHDKCDAQYKCGNITAGFPFSGGNRHKHCGHPLLELHCYIDTTSLLISDHQYHVLHINQTSYTLTLVRADLQEPFCSPTFTTATLPPEIFNISSTYKSVTFHRVNHSPHRSSYTCPEISPIFVSEKPIYSETCLSTFSVNVPTSFLTKEKEKELDMEILESVLRNGFEVKLKIDVKACQECSSSYGFCGFNQSMPLDVKCNPYPLHLINVNNSRLHKHCSGPFSCGNQKELFYPFWTSGREGCGHPEFKLNCSGGYAELSIASVTFRILEVIYGSGIIRLARLDYTNDLCPQDPIDAPFDETILPFAPNTELLTIYYDCSQDFSPRVSTYVGELACGEDSDDERYYVTRNLSSPLLRSISPLLNRFRGFCNRNVSIPASGQALNTLQLTSSRDNLKKAIEYGFELGLNEECLRCIGSDGACGYNQSTNSFACYYLEKPHNKGLSTAAIAGIAAATSVLGLAILVVACLFCIRRRRKTQEAQYTSKDLPTTSYSSRETSRNPTSTTFSSSSNHSLLPSISNLTNGSHYYGVQVFSYDELEEATENFSRELGDGGFGTVYYGVLKDGRAVAVKRLYERSLKRVEQFKNEIEILKSLKHPNLVILYGCTSRHSRELLLVYEYISNGTLSEHLHGDRAQARPLCWSTRLNVAIETASALSYLHKSGIIHRDVKTTNILLDDNHQVKVADFGLSRLFPMDQTHISTAPQGTPGYVDPEYYQCYRLNEKSDVYSFGVVLTELISSKEAVDITRHRHDINLANMAVSKIQNNALHELVDSSLGFDKDPEVKRKMMSVAELAFRCLQQEREVRPSMNEIVEILREVKDGEKRVMVVESPDVVDIDGSGGDDVGLLRHNSVPPPISPGTEWTSSSDTAASL